jgi:hypothetical protein
MTQPPTAATTPGAASPLVAALERAWAAIRATTPTSPRPW